MMSSSSIENKVPYSIIFPNDPLYRVSPHVFGCTCFVHNVSPGLDKLSTKAIKCVFLGYSCLQKGYKCYSPSTKRYYMSTNVTFFEDTYFFLSSMEESSSVQQVIPLPSRDPLVIPETQPPTQNANDIVQPPLLTYQRHTPMTPSLPEDPWDSNPSRIDSRIMDPSSSSSSLDSDHTWPIALRKGIRSTRNSHPIYNFLSYHCLSPPYFSFVSSLSTIKVPNNVDEALGHPGWRQAMIDEMQALEHSGTWELVSLPPGKKPVGCRWVYAIKVDPTSAVDGLKACLVAKGYT